MKKRIVTISRQYGSGGHAVAERLSQELGIPLYDNEAISTAVQDSELDQWQFPMADTMRKTSLLYTLSNTTPRFDLRSMPYDEAIFKAQSEAIKRLADEGPGIFVGRCGNYVLQNREDCVHVFICGSLEARARRAVEVYGLDSKDPMKQIRRVDRAREAYYNGNTGLRWGFGANYDLSINTDEIGVEGAVALIKAYMEL